MSDSSSLAPAPHPPQVDQRLNALAVRLVPALRKQQASKGTKKNNETKESWRVLKAVTGRCADLSLSEFVLSLLVRAATYAESCARGRDVDHGTGRSARAAGAVIRRTVALPAHVSTQKRERERESRRGANE